MMAAQSRILAIADHDQAVEQARLLVEMAHDILAEVLVDYPLADFDEAAAS